MDSNWACFLSLGSFPFMVAFGLSVAVDMATFISLGVSTDASVEFSSMLGFSGFWALVPLGLESLELGTTGAELVISGTMLDTNAMELEHVSRLRLGGLVLPSELVRFGVLSKEVELITGEGASPFGGGLSTFISLVLGSSFSFPSVVGADMISHSTPTLVFCIG